MKRAILLATLGIAACSTQKPLATVTVDSVTRSDTVRAAKDNSGFGSEAVFSPEGKEWITVRTKVVYNRCDDDMDALLNELSGAPASSPTPKPAAAPAKMTMAIFTAKLGSLETADGQKIRAAGGNAEDGPDHNVMQFEDSFMMKPCANGATAPLELAFVFQVPKGFDTSKATLVYRGTKVPLGAAK